MTDFLTWLVYGGSITYARKHWSALKNPTIEERARASSIWDNIWALQRQLGCPPVGLIRSC